MTKSKTITPERKNALTQICDSESYAATIRLSLSPEQIAAHNPLHMANVLALVAENYLEKYDEIWASFAIANSLTINFKCDLADGIDKVKLSFLPTAKVECERSASVGDGQPDLGDIKNEAKGRAPRPEKTVLALVAPVIDVDEAPPEDEGIESFVMQVDKLVDDDEETHDFLKTTYDERGRSWFEKAELFAKECQDISHYTHSLIHNALQEF